MVDSTTIRRNMATMGAKATDNGARLRKPATAAARGAALALRSTACLAEAVDREAAHLLSTSEGVSRVALSNKGRYGTFSQTPDTRSGTSLPYGGQLCGYLWYGPRPER